MSNHYQTTLDHIVDAQKNLLADLIDEVTNLTEQINELLIEKARLEVYAREQYDQGYGEGHKYGRDSGYEAGYEMAVRDHASA